MDTLDFGVVQQLVSVLQGADVRASTNPEDLNLPAAWVTVETVTELTVGRQIQLQCAVYLITGDTDDARAYTGLAELYNKAATVMSPDGPVTVQGVVMPGNPTPMPALRVPINLI